MIYHSSKEQYPDFWSWHMGGWGANNDKGVEITFSRDYISLVYDTYRCSSNVSASFLANRLADFIIVVGDTRPSSSSHPATDPSFTECYRYPGYPEGGETVTVTCEPAPVWGRFVSLYLPRQDWLLVTEIQVFGHTVTSVAISTMAQIQSTTLGIIESQSTDTQAHITTTDTQSMGTPTQSVMSTGTTESQIATTQDQRTMTETQSTLTRFQSTTPIITESQSTVAQDQNTKTQTTQISAFREETRT